MVISSKQSLSRFTLTFKRISSLLLNLKTLKLINNQVVVFRKSLSLIKLIHQFHLTEKAKKASLSRISCLSNLRIWWFKTYLQFKCLKRERMRSNISNSLWFLLKIARMSQVICILTSVLGLHSNLGFLINLRNPIYNLKRVKRMERQIKSYTERILISRTRCWWMTKKRMKMIWIVLKEPKEEKKRMLPSFKKDQPFMKAQNNHTLLISPLFLTRETITKCQVIAAVVKI